MRIKCSQFNNQRSVDTYILHLDAALWQNYFCFIDIWTMTKIMLTFQNLSAVIKFGLIAIPSVLMHSYRLEKKYNSKLNIWSQTSEKWPPAIILSVLKGDYYGTAVIPKMNVWCAVGNKYKFLLFSYFKLC
jgi:hypothetical protein